jgi:hypothetical protein
MSRKNNLDGIELSIVVTTTDYNPKLLNLGFLIDNQIIPNQWQNGQQLICTDDLSQVIFNNTINIVSSKNRISFIEDIDYKTLSEINSPTIALHSTNALSKLIDINYLNIDINFKGYIVYPQSSDLPHRYIFETLVRPPIQEWMEVGDANVQGSLSFFYSLKEREFKFSIDEAILKTSQLKESPVLLFTGNFNYNISENNSKLDIKDCKAILRWFDDLETYQKTVDQFVHLI